MGGAIVCVANRQGHGRQRLMHLALQLLQVALLDSMLVSGVHLAKLLVA